MIAVVRGAMRGRPERIDEAIDSGDPELIRGISAPWRTSTSKCWPPTSRSDTSGSSHDDWLRLADTVDFIVHPAALVNHVLPYAQLFGPNVVGTAELIRLALTGKLKRFVNVSTVAVAMRAETALSIDEEADVRVAVPTPLAREQALRERATRRASGRRRFCCVRRHARFGLPVSNFRSDMILAHSRWRGQLNVPDMFTRLIYSIVKTGLAPRSFYRHAGDGSRTAPTTTACQWISLPLRSTETLGESVTSGFQTYHVLNPHDDAILDGQFVDWIAETGLRVQRVDDYTDWVGRFETALKALPEKERQHDLPAAPAPVANADVRR